jgi:hypothetical protein
VTNDEWAETKIAEYVAGTKSGRLFWTYGDMAAATGRKGQHRLMGAALDRVGEICANRGLPDCSTMIVTKTSLLDGTVEPSNAALAKHSGWTGLREAQSNCLTFNWLVAL